MTRSVPIASVNDSIETVKRIFKEIKKLKSINYVTLVIIKLLKGNSFRQRIIQQTRNKHNGNRGKRSCLCLKNLIGKRSPI